MSKENNLEQEEFAEAIKILDKNIKEMEEKADKDIKIEKSNEVEEPIINEDTILAQQSSFYLSFIMTILMTLINPILKKYQIDEVTPEETEELSQALMGIISDKMLSTSGKIGNALSKIMNLPKILKLLAVVWKIGLPRLTNFLEAKKNKPANVDLNL